jgi:hypothetical protein
MGTIVSFGNSIVGFGSSGGIVGAPASPVSPFDVVSDSDTDRNLQMRYNEIPGYNSNNNYNRGSNPRSMLYRKVKVNSTVRITAWQTNTNTGPNGSFQWETWTTVLNSQVPIWPTATVAYTTDLTPIVITDPALDMCGEAYMYRETGTGNNWTWWYSKAYCYITLQPGEYWWPLFFYEHGNSVGKTQFGYHTSAPACDLMVLSRYNNPNYSPKYPPIYSTISTRPYLHLTDENGNEYSV